MAPQRAKTAFQFYQAESLSDIKAELGGSMGEAMTVLAQRWKALGDSERKKYKLLEKEERERFERESREADALAMREQERRRQAMTTVSQGEERGARAKLDAERLAKEEKRRQRELDLDPEVLQERERLKNLKKKETEERQNQRQKEEKAVKERHRKLDKQAALKATQRLDYLLKQSSIFAKLKMGSGSAKSAPMSPKSMVHHRDDKIHHDESDELEKSDEEDEEHVFLTKQPSTIVGGTLKAYQLEGLNWMIHLAEKGLNGILADEMGLGKTLQSISILAYQYEFLNIQGPHLVVVPKSTLSNWMNELKRWCPSLRAIRFHGVREEKEALIAEYFTNEAAAHDGRRPRKRIQNEETGEWEDDNSDNPRAWDVCVTTYEVCNTERKTLQKFAWRYLIIDEAHRLKNEASLFSKVVRTLHTNHRLLLTGTPLQNNLHELWALLNFLLPDIFASSEQFDEWFDLDIDDEDAKKNMISQLHKILRPFMIRRLKSDVAKGLPPKTETLIMVGMSTVQKQLYKRLLLRDIEAITSSGNKNRTAILNIVMQLRKCCGHPYLFDGIEDRTLDPLGEHLVQNCGKLNMVDKLLKKLKERGSRVLIFTQMTRILDILEDFMVMRGYQYCRIDGNTAHEDREASIDEFNREGSEKFCFILSTRAGGLGINLQTADTCILYDSDWNPQADLQAQDRCHRLGQKKPVNIYRLVSENTVEEKIVERAQQKLKLDAVVVQQGRLKDKDKISKEEIMNAVRFGADTVFRSEESTITDEDIDIILERGKAKTAELAEKIKKAEKGDLLDFRLDGGISAQTFEGVDYSDKELRNQLRLLAADSIGKRERRPPPSDYNPIILAKKSMVVNNQRIKLPKSLRLPQMEDHHFYNRERLLELGDLEFQTYATLRELGRLPSRAHMDESRTLLPPELAQEKLELLEEGFGNWTKSDYFRFVKAATKFGRHDIVSIAADMDMPENAVAAYSHAFWTYGEMELKKDEWERVLGSIDRGEKRIEKRKKLTSLLGKFVGTFENPREELIFANKGTTHFSLEQDRALLLAVSKHGHGNWDSVREELRNDNALTFQHMVQGMSADMIAKRADYRMRQMEKEYEAREKTLKNQKPANVVAAEKAIAAIKEMEVWETEARRLQILGQDAPSMADISVEGKQMLQERMKDRQPMIDRLREIEIQVRGCKALAEETRHAILRGDQYVNYSNITLKAGGPSEEDVPASGEDIEAKINAGVLRVPECGECKPCLDDSSRKLCDKRMEAREELIRIETKRMKESRAKGGKSKKRKAPSKSPKPKATTAPAPSSNKQKMMKKASGVLAPRVTSQGNKRMSIPDELFPDFCRRIGAYGTGERMKLINTFVEEHPDISVRQVTLKFSDITMRTVPSWIPPPEKKSGRSFVFYLRPRFYHLLPENDRPNDWERLAEEDDVLWKQEQMEKKKEKEHKEEKIKVLMDDSTTKSQTSAGVDSVSDIAVEAEVVDDGTEDGDDVHPAKKRKASDD